MKRREKSGKGMKYRIIGIMTMVLMLTMVVSVSASNGTRTLEVIYSDIQLVVDGIKVELGLDTSGDSIEPFILNGTTYLPVRAVAEALGEEVGWDGSTKTVYIGKRNVTDDKEKYIGNGIEYIDYKEGSSYHRFGYVYNDETYIMDNVGNKGNNYIFLNLDNDWMGRDKRWNYIEFPTNGLYSKFRGTVALSDTYKETSAISVLEVYADDTLVAQYPIESGVMSQEIEVDIKNALKVRFKYYVTDFKESGTYGTSALIFNPRFVE